MLNIALYSILYNKYKADERCQAAYLSHYDTDMDGRLELGLNDDVSFEEAFSLFHTAENDYVLICATLFKYVHYVFACYASITYAYMD